MPRALRVSPGVLASALGEVPGSEQVGQREGAAQYWIDIDVEHFASAPTRARPIWREGLNSLQLGMKKSLTVQVSAIFGAAVHVGLDPQQLVADLSRNDSAGDG